MPVSVTNPYSGQDDETCSVSFAAQQKMAGTVGSPQTEADYNKSKLLGEWGVVKAKLAQGGIPNGTKVLSFTNTAVGARGYLYVKGGTLHKKVYLTTGQTTDLPIDPDKGEIFIKGSMYSASIPQAVSPKPKPEAGPPEWTSLVNAGLLTPGSEFYYHGDTKTAFKLQGVLVVVKEHPLGGKTARILVDKETGEQVAQQASNSAKWWVSKKPQKAPPPPDFTKLPDPPSSPQPVAAPTPATPVNAGSDSPGSMSHEDVAAMFVKIKDDLAKEKGLNIKGANPELDQEVFKAIGNATGYTPAEVKAKIDAYKAAGNKLSALKKKVLAGTKQVPTGKAAQKPAAPSTPLVGGSGGGSPDPKPNGVPTVATPKLVQEVKQEVKQTVEADPAKVYSDEDVAAAYIIAKDQVVAASNGKWTLYSKSDEMDLEIAIKVGLKTGLNPAQQKQAIANYLGSGKKLSVLKKQLIKQGAFEAKADTLKKSGAAKTQAEKAKDIEAKADAGYTPTPNPATGTPKMETGKPTPRAAREKAEEAGDISTIPDYLKPMMYAEFKKGGAKSYLSSSASDHYELLLAMQKELKMNDAGEYTLLQLVRVVDEEGAKKFGAENTHLFEKKMVEWLSSPSYQTYVEAKLKKDKLEAEAKALADNQPVLPADSAQYEPWTLEKAKRISETWLEAKPWTAKEKRDLKHYTGSAYTEMNGYLRGLKSSIGERSKTAIDGSRSGMRPTTEPILVQRGTGLNQFQTLGVERGSGDAVFGITGKTFKDEGFLSTSAGGRAAFGGEAKLEIECPVGTPMAYVAPISKYPHENEMLLQAGMEYKVLNVRKENGKYIVRVRVVNWPGKAS